MIRQFSRGGSSNRVRIENQTDSARVKLLLKETENDDLFETRNGFMIIHLHNRVRDGVGGVHNLYLQLWHGLLVGLDSLVTLMVGLGSVVRLMDGLDSFARLLVVLNGTGGVLLVFWDKNCGIAVDFVGNVVILLASKN